MSVAETLTALREQKGLTRVELAEKSGVSFQSIYKYESGKIENLNLNSIEKLCKALSVSPIDLLGWKLKPEVDENSYSIPVYSKISGPVPVPMSDDIVGYVTYHTSGETRAEDLFALRVNAKPGMRFVKDGDVVFIIRKQSEVQGTHLGAVVIDGGDMIISQVEFFMDKIVCTPLSEDLPRATFHWSDIESKRLQYIGICIEYRKELLEGTIYKK